MKCRWAIIGGCFIMSIGNVFLWLKSGYICGQLATLWALVGTMSWLICKVIDEISEYMDRF
jgi:hypothetical protein